MSSDTTTRLNSAVQQFSDEVLADMRANIASLGVRGKQYLLRSIKSEKAKAKMQERISTEGVLTKMLKRKIYYQYGEAFGVGFKMPKHAIFLVKGVGGVHKISNPREAKDFANNPIDKRMDKLADQVAEIYGDKVEINAFRAKIK